MYKMNALNRINNSIFYRINVYKCATYLMPLYLQNKTFSFRRIRYYFEEKIYINIKYIYIKMSMKVCEKRLYAPILNEW